LEENENVEINIVDRQTSWKVVQRKKKKKKKNDTLSEKWTKQQKENFERFGDIWYQEPYDNYHVTEHSTPVALAPQPQAQVQQLPVLQQQPIGQPQLPVLPPQQPVVVAPQLPVGQHQQPAPVQPQQGGQLAILKIIVTPPPLQRIPTVQKRHLEAIPEEDEATGSRRPKIEDAGIPVAKVTPGSSPPPVDVQLERRGRPDSHGPPDEQLGELFEQLKLSPERKAAVKSPLSSGSKASPTFQSALSSPKLLIPRAAAGSPLQRTRQMEKDLAHTLYQRLLEAEASEKKKKKDLEKAKKYADNPLYQRLLEAEAL